MTPRTRFSIMAAVIVVVTSALILSLLTLLDHRLGRSAVEHTDLLLQLKVHASANPLLTSFMLALTWLGAIKIFAPALLCVAVWLLLRGRTRDAMLLGGGIASAFALNETLKEHFHRLRPQVPWSIGDEHTFSFPSGHSLFAVVLYGTLAYVALGRKGDAGRRFGLVAVACLMPLGIGVSRIYLGMHYPTDVIAGWLAGALWLTAILMIDWAWRVQLQRPPGT